MSDELTEEQLRARFERRVVPYFEDLREQAGGGSSWPPVLVYVGGQPGAGKSRANERAAQSRQALVPIIGDDLRQFHPDYARLMRDDPLAMPGATAQASGRWIGMAADYLREQRADVLIETTLRSPDAMAKTIASFREAGYVVELRTVAVPHEVSRLATVERYVAQVEATGAGRWTPAAAHDEAYMRAGPTIEGLVQSGSVDHFVIEDRTGVVSFDRSYFGVRDAGLQQAGREAGAAFERARSIDHMTPAAARSWIELARDQIERVRGLGQQDPDLLSTVERIGTTDARAVVARAYPEEPARASAAAMTLSAAARAASTGPSAAGASYPQPPRAGSQRGSSPRYRGPAMPDRGSGLEPGM
ncbi:zeta toxin family protein [Propionibacterium australiense]|uniref:UDP-N-acetylglucosamine kinase n=1 Tax=Propionibacterium australiense TaxID=119981 RepID=A0A383S9Q7_9ACTN|nr:zeta toxin family protein [Propionibacterium australiense]RLP07178.1 hypothetical protein D9T14_10540 [Propionibacterium australiense]RLP07534.1 hypothetical protein D7U36_11030 [Propionibacterium australiense]SYZ34154.1 kinase-like domain [Propionibacterium australiense]VEH92569.1 UDP-N-acetylglucosamine kinase [Propionibacterium australiense]